MTTLDIMLPALHRSQHRVASHPARFKVLACGRRWGKTRMGSLLCIMTALQRKRAWWVAPTYKMAAVGWRGIVQLAAQIPGVVIRQGEFLVTMPGGGWVQVRSADNPNSLRGEGLDFVVMDECAFMQEIAWTEALRPALSDRLGRALFISTPSGRNWFWRLWMLGQEEGDEWQSWRFPTADNPFIAAGEIEAARASLPELVFSQEYLAEFIEDGGIVFRYVTRAATAVPQERAVPGHTYIFGVDWGRSGDYSATSVVDATLKAEVALDRFTGVEFEIQYGRLQALYERFRPAVIIAEQNAIGIPATERLQRMGLPVQPFVTTNATKTQIVDALALAFERGEIAILDDPVQIAELQAFGMDRTPGGLIRYGAPEGFHDDTVMALALAWWGALDTGPLLLW